MKGKSHEIPAGYFKIHCLQLIDEVSQKRLPIIITKHGKPMAKLMPINQEQASLFGCLKNSVVIVSDIIEGTGEAWDAEQ
jgi:prevent-host-death family protein